MHVSYITICILCYRGRPILIALIQHLLDNGMSNATDVILTGCSGHLSIMNIIMCMRIIIDWLKIPPPPPPPPLSLAGGVATFIDADFVSTLLPDGINYKAMSDGG